MFYSTCKHKTEENSITQHNITDHIATQQNTTQQNRKEQNTIQHNRHDTIRQSATNTTQQTILQQNRREHDLTRHSPVILTSLFFLPCFHCLSELLVQVDTICPFAMFVLQRVSATWPGRTAAHVILSLGSAAADTGSEVNGVISVLVVISSFRAAYVSTRDKLCNSHELPLRVTDCEDLCAQLHFHCCQCTARAILVSVQPIFRAFTIKGPS